MKAEFACAWCGKASLKERGAINRAQNSNLSLYCGRACSGLGRRKNKSNTQKIAEKSEYDRKYRSTNLTALKKKKAAYFQKTYDPFAARVVRKARMPHHLAYCRTPEYRRKKQAYDLIRRAKEFGDLEESYVLLHHIELEIASRATRYEIYSANETLNKSLKRKRAYEQFDRS